MGGSTEPLSYLIVLTASHVLLAPVPGDPQRNGSSKVSSSSQNPNLIQLQTQETASAWAGLRSAATLLTPALPYLPEAGGCQEEEWALTAYSASKALKHLVSNFFQIKFHKAHLNALFLP